MLTIDHYARVDLDKAIQPETLNGVLCTFDAYANKFRTKLCRGGQDMALVECTVTGYFTVEDEEPWKVTGKVENGEAVVTLPLGCLTKAGRFTLAIKAGNGITESTIRIIRGNVVQTVSADLWKTVQDFTAIQTAPGKVTFTVTPYVDVQFYRVYEIVNGEPTFKTQLFGTLSTTMSVSDGEHYYCVQPMMADRNGGYTIAGNMSEETGVYVS